MRRSRSRQKNSSARSLMRNHPGRCEIMRWRQNAAGGICLARPAQPQLSRWDRRDRRDRDILRLHLRRHPPAVDSNNTMPPRDDVAEVPDSEDELMTSSPLPMADVNDKLPSATRGPLQASQGVPQGTACHLQAPGHVSHSASRPEQSLSVERNDSSINAEPTDCCHDMTNLQSQSASSSQLSKFEQDHTLGSHQASENESGGNNTRTDHPAQSKALDVALQMARSASIEPEEGNSVRTEQIEQLEALDTCIGRLRKEFSEPKETPLQQHSDHHTEEMGCPAPQAHMEERKPNDNSLAPSGPQRPTHLGHDNDKEVLEILARRMREPSEATELASSELANHSRTDLSHASDTVLAELPAQRDVPTNSITTPKELSAAKAQHKTTLTELKAQRAALMASLAARSDIQDITAEMVDYDDPDAEATDVDLMAAANKIVKNHIKLLHEYNEIKDVGQGLMGLIADQRGVRIVEIQDEFGITTKD